jgi:Poly(hydroxyalcanoate) granule associated protein (phasin)
MEGAYRAIFIDEETEMTNTNRLTMPRAGENVLAASRQVWLATLGAASVTREWAGKEAGPVFRTLVAEGANVESKLMRRVGRRLEANISRGSALLRHARRGIETSAQMVANAAASLARRTMPRVRVAVTADSVAISAQAPRGKAPVKAAKRATQARKTTGKAVKAPVAAKRGSARRVAAK